MGTFLFSYLNLKKKGRLTMETIKDYETNHFLNNIRSVTGRRYNIPGPIALLQNQEQQEGEENNEKKPNEENILISRNLSKDDVSGWFKTVHLSEDHIKLLEFVNSYKVTDLNMGIPFLNFKKKKEQFFNLVDECVLTGLIYEIYIKSNSKKYYLYMVDTGGIYTLEELGVEHYKVPYTIPLKEKYKIWRTADLCYDVMNDYIITGHYELKCLKTGERYKAALLEDIDEPKIETCQEPAIFLVNTTLLEELKLTPAAENIVKKLKDTNNKHLFYDLDKRKKVFA